MKSVTEEYLLSFQERIQIAGKLDFDSCKEYIRALPALYRSDIEFRLLFDWHFSPQGRQLAEEETHPLFQFQRGISYSLGKQFNLDYQFLQFFIFHAMNDMRGKKILEIGGSLPNTMLFDLFEVAEYINNESPDYIQAESGDSYSSRHGEHPCRTTVIVNAEEIHNFLDHDSIDAIFSVACFEHVYDLDLALQSCYKVTKKGGILYSFFAPIYSYLTDGHHGVIPQHPRFSETPWGLHLLTPQDQRKYLQHNGIQNPKEIQEFLGSVNFNRVPNRLKFEDYSRILTESPYYVVKLDEVAPNHNISKRFPSETLRVRNSNPDIKNLHSQGFRVVLQKL